MSAVTIDTGPLGPALILVQECQLVGIERFEEFVRGDPLERLLAGEAGKINTQDARILLTAGAFHMGRTAAVLLDPMARMVS